MRTVDITAISSDGAQTTQTLITFDDFVFCKKSSPGTAASKSEQLPCSMLVPGGGGMGQIFSEPLIENSCRLFWSGPS